MGNSCNALHAQVRATTPRLRLQDGGQLEVPLPCDLEALLTSQLQRPQLVDAAAAAAAAAGPLNGPAGTTATATRGGAVGATVAVVKREPGAGGTSAAASGPVGSAPHQQCPAAATGAKGSGGGGVGGSGSSTEAAIVQESWCSKKFRDGLQDFLRKQVRIKRVCECS
jgi:hypothetical protein